MRTASKLAYKTHNQIKTNKTHKTKQKFFYVKLTTVTDYIIVPP
jgi:hypothetical protein